MDKTINNNTEKQYRSFTVAYFVLFIGFIVAVAVFNVVADPAGIYNYVDIEGFNTEKTAIMDGGGRRDKAQAIKSGNFDTIILGTSRAELGLNPLGPAFKGSRAYNGSLPGSHFFEIEKVFSFAADQSELKRAVLSLDFFTFYEESTGKGDFAQSGFAGKGGLSEMMHLISINELVRSFDTVKDNLRGKEAPYTRFGNRTELDPKKKGAKKNSIIEIMKRTFVKGRIYERGAASPSQVELLRSIIKRSREDGTELALFISPIHALQLEFMDLTGTYTHFEDWKRALARAVAEEAKANPKTKLTLWDFSGYNSMTIEKFPEPTYTVKEMSWYWEPTHYKEELGELILRRVLSGRGGARVPADFGVAITPKNIEEHLRKDRLSRDDYRRENSDLVKRLNRLYADSARERAEYRLREAPGKGADKVEFR
ncbi:MAG: hypothetical protein V3T30_06425 [Thermodesulfobacteriota bacterium]